MPYSNIDKPSKYFNTKLYTGTGASNAVTGVGFKPDWVWLKRRDSSASHALFDINRGVNKQLRTNTTGADETVSWFPSFDTDGFTVSTTESDGNASGGTYTSWNWLGANTTVSNTSGSISSTVSANTTSGFSVVSYTGTRTPTANQSIGHGLGAVPSMIIVKNRTTGTRGWRVYHKSLGTPDKELILNSTASVGTDTATWQNTTPTSSLFYVGASGETNNTGDNFIAYCFAEVKGFSKAFSYVGNGSADGVFVNLGFRPAWVMVKASSTTGQWAICDNRRGTANTANGAFLFAESSEATNSAPANWDFLSNGLKARAGYAAHNSSGVTYIGLAFAENPFVSSKGIPTCAF